MPEILSPLPVSRMTSAPVASTQHTVFLATLRLASELSSQAGGLLKTYELSTAQYNVLRILRGAEQPLTSGQIGERLISRDPDVTRLIDRLEQQGLVSRERSVLDRRVVSVRISEAALDLLRQLDAPMLALHEQQFSALRLHELETLHQLLLKVQSKS